MTVSQLFAVWIGFRLGGEVLCMNLGEEHLRAMRRGERMPIPGTNFNVQRISCDHKLLGYGHIVHQSPLDQAFQLNTADLEDMRAAIKKELEANGIFAPIDICAERITPLDGKDVHD